MICPHCGHEVNPDPQLLYVNLNNNGCNPAPIVQVIPNIANANPIPMPLGWQTTNMAAGCGPLPVTTFIKF